MPNIRGRWTSWAASARRANGTAVSNTEISRRMIRIMKTAAALGFYFAIEQELWLAITAQNPFCHAAWCRQFFTFDDNRECNFGCIRHFLESLDGKGRAN